MMMMSRLLQEDRLTYVAHRAYELAGSGRHEDFASVEQAIVDEGFSESVPWLERAGVIEALNEICFGSRRIEAMA